MTMIDLSRTPTTKLRTCFIAGAWGSGKTHLCATWPRPAVLCAGREGGYETIANMEPGDFYEPGRIPLVFAIASLQESVVHIHRDIWPRVQRGEIKTIVVEATFYSDDIVRGAPKSDNKWAPYANLLEHMIWLDNQCKRIPGLRLVYNAIEREADGPNASAGVQLAGRALGRKLPAMCDLVGLLCSEGDALGNVSRRLHLTPFGQFPARHRFGRKLPPVVCNPSFRALEMLIGGQATCDALGNVTGPGLTPASVTLPSVLPTLPLPPLGGAPIPSLPLPPLPSQPKQ
jgi:hypothetical protein